VQNRLSLLVLTLLLIAALGLYHWSRELLPEAPRDEALVLPETMEAPAPPRQAGTPPIPKSVVPVVKELVAPPEEGISERSDAPPAAGLATPPPMSRVSHRVARSWGRDTEGRPKGALGLTVIVDPSISNAEIFLLAEDIIDANSDAEIMNVQIFDSEEAASPEAHSAHDPLIRDHMVGQVFVNGRSGIRKVKVRGEVVDSLPLQPEGARQNP